MIGWVLFLALLQSVQTELQRETKVRQEAEKEVTSLKEEMTSQQRKSQQLIDALQTQNKEYLKAKVS